MGDAFDTSQGEIPFAALHAAEIRAVHPDQVGEGLL
jgi:hypothetical protein